MHQHNAILQWQLIPEEYNIHNTIMEFKNKIANLIEATNNYHSPFSKG